MGQQPVLSQLNLVVRDMPATLAFYPKARPAHRGARRP